MRGELWCFESHMSFPGWSLFTLPNSSYEPSAPSFQLQSLCLSAAMLPSMLLDSSSSGTVSPTQTLFSINCLGHRAFFFFIQSNRKVTKTKARRDPWERILLEGCVREEAIPLLTNQLL